MLCEKNHGCGKGSSIKLEAQRTDWCQMRMISQGGRKFRDLINEHGDLDPLFPATRSCHLLLVKCDKVFVSKTEPQRGKPLFTRQLMLYYRGLCTPCIINPNVDHQTCQIMKW